MKILLVEDEAVAAELLRESLARSGWTVATEGAGDRALLRLGREVFDVVVADVELPGLSGIELARRVLAGPGEAPRFILVSGQDRIIESVNALELGVEDFLPKPLNLKRLTALLKRLETRRDSPPLVPAEELRRLLEGRSLLELDELPEPGSLLPPGEAPFIGVYGPRMLEVCERLRKVAPYPDVSVLIEGETGTGKELVARYAAMVDQESEGPFVGVNCSLFNSEFFAAELFGYEAGAFTGAAPRGRTGKLDLAAGGCLFLDEITEMSPELQSRLLRVLQERSFYRLGGDSLVEVGCRFVFATNRDIRRLVAEGLFREDLFYRLSLCIVKLPPLRERSEEILPLALRFLRALAAGPRLRARRVETRALSLLETYPWPGNARELQNVISSWALFETGDCLRRESLEGILGGGRERSPRPSPPLVQGGGSAPLRTGAREAGPASGPASAGGLAALLEGLSIPDEPFELAALEREIVRRTLEKFGGNKARTAEFLGISRSQLYDKYRPD